MKNHHDALAVVTAAIFLNLAAWGNAMAMLLASAATLGIWLISERKASSSARTESRPSHFGGSLGKYAPDDTKHKGEEPLE
jgi:hypothetical protein